MNSPLDGLEEMGQKSGKPNGTQGITCPDHGRLPIEVQKQSNDEEQG